MPILKPSDSDRSQAFPGVARLARVSGDKGSTNLTVGELTVGPGARVPVHIHPGHEEAMVILEGTMDAVLGDERVPVGAGTTVLAPKGIKHGFINTSNRPAKVMFIFPTVNVERVEAE